MDGKGEVGPPRKVEAQRSDGSRPISDQQLVVDLVVAYIVGVFAEAHVVERLECAAVEATHRPVPAAGDVNGPIGRYVGHALGALQALDLRGALALRDVDHLDGSVTESGDKNALALDIGGKMVNAALHAGKRNLAFEFERSRGCLGYG